MSRHRSSTKKAPPEIGLHMECTEEDLEPCQVVYYNKAETEYNEIQNKIDYYLNKMKAEVIEKGENCMVLQLNASTPTTHSSSTQVTPVASSGKITRQSVQSAQNYQQVVGQGILTRSSGNTTGNTYLVMDPRLGLVVGQVPQNSVPAENTATAPAKSASGSRSRPAPGAVMVTTRARSGMKKSGSNTESEVITSTPIRTREKVKGQQVQSPVSPPTNQVIQQVFSPSNSTTPAVSYRVKLNAKPLPALSKPSENTAIGGLTAGTKTPWKPNSDEGGSKGNAADSKEVSFNKMSGKTFPSLVVAARPHLRVKFMPQSNITQERTALDAKVKGVLMYIPATFTEWLIQEGLVKNEQVCQFHVNNDLTPVKLKLGMYRETSKFPYSGGYVWLSPCCPFYFVSVFSGSIFEGAPHPPTTLLKLIYHWACQTNVQNVIHWVKVDSLYVKNFFTNMRAVCTQAIHQKHQKLGGPRSKIEVGVISLGTTSQDGNMRQVKVEVLGVMDAENKLIRLRALEPISEEKNLKRRFIKILEPLEEWVHKESTIFTDFTVDKGTLLNMGFRTVYQVSANDHNTKYNNQNVMEYLRRIVPRMFQNTLSLLSRQIIQQFLDELVWREMWGPIPSQAFDNIIAHIAEQTKLDASESLLYRLNKVASNPFKTWNYSVWKPAAISLSNTKAQQPTADLDTVPLFNQLATMEAMESESSPVKKARTRKRAPELPPVGIKSPAKKSPKLAVKEKVKKEEKLKDGEKSDSAEKMITEDVVAFVNDKTSQRPLDSYYYGTKDGEEEMIASEYKGTFEARCTVCHKRFDNNISIMKHMILHAQTEPPLKVALNSVQQCSYCFLGFNTNIELKEHLDEVHPAVQNDAEKLMECQICEEVFPDRVELVYHMHRMHVELELPYECGVCFFRTSVYRLLIEHFVQVHKGGEHVLCPFCLKVVAVSYKGKLIPINVGFYESHLERHSRAALTKNCYRCKLSFIHKGILNQHVDADHCSFKDESGVKPFADSPDSVLMPEPGGVIKPFTPPKSLKIYRARPSFTSNKFKELEISGVTDDMACVECEGSMMSSDHFCGSFNCAKCRYATCCERAITEHVTVFHESPTQTYSLGKPIVLPDRMYCVCGYSSLSGNKLAKHIAICERVSAYPTEEAANNAIVVKEEPSKPQQTGDSQNMLNMLGLVRKSPEGGSGTEVKRETESEAVEDTRQEQNDSIESKGEPAQSVCSAESSAEIDSSEQRDESSKTEIDESTPRDDAHKSEEMVNEQVEMQELEEKSVVPGVKAAPDGGPEDDRTLDIKEEPIELPVIEEVKHIEEETEGNAEKDEDVEMEDGTTEMPSNEEIKTEEKMDVDDVEVPVADKVAEDVPSTEEQETCEVASEAREECPVTDDGTEIEKDEAAAVESGGSNVMETQEE